MEIDRISVSDQETTTTVSQERAESDSDRRSQPGPACSKRRRGTRARDGSTSSTTPRSKSAGADVAAQRKSSREAAREANRLIAGRGREQEDPIHLDPDTDESEEGKPPPKRMAQEDGEEPFQEKRKRGRPQETGLYVGRAEAMEALNQKKREQAQLEEESIIRNLTTTEVLSNVTRAVEDVLEELEYAPTEDVAQRVRQSMAEVLKVAKSSKNLKGGYVKILRSAAVVGSASAEVLRLRAEKEGSEGDSQVKVRDLRRELELTKREVRTAKYETEKAKAETEKLREELERSKRKERTRRRVREVVSASPSPSPSPNRTRGDAEEKEYASTVEMEDGPSTSNEVAVGADPCPPGAVPGPSGAVPDLPETVADPPEYSDVRRRAELLPPGTVMPPVIRPAIRGKATVIEDDILDGIRVRVVPDNRPAAVKASRSKGGPTIPEAPASGQSLVDILTPRLTEWLRTTLPTLGLDGITGAAGKEKARPTKEKGKDGREGEKRPSTPQPMLRKPGKEKEVRSTTVPNKELWSEVVGRGTGGVALPKPPTAAKKGAGGQQRGGPTTVAPDKEGWTTVDVRKKKKKKAKQAPTAETEAPKNAVRSKEPKAAGGRAQARCTTAKPAPNKREGGDKKADPAMKPPVRRPPRTAAVTLTCPPDKYAEAMRLARQRVNLREIGIQALRPKRAATGAIILEVPGPDGAAKAAVLRERMEEALRDMEGVKVARPVKQGDLRIKGIIDSTTVEEIRKEIARLGECKEEEVRTGDIRPAPDGLGSMWLQCPLVAANRAAAAGRLQLGWSSPTIEALEPRTMRCFRCLEQGHVQAACPGTIDRRSLCYRCSQEGHLARTCNSAPHCAICAGLGRPSGHKMGGKACKAPAKKAGPPRTKKPATSEPMEVNMDETPPAVRGEPAQNRGAPVPVRRGKSNKEHRPAVRGGPAHLDRGDRVPVPVRPEQEKTEEMDVEVERTPAPARPNYDDDNATKTSPDAGAPDTAAPSPPC